MRDILESPRPSLSASEAVELLIANYGIDGSAHSLDSERDQNYLISTERGQKYLLRIANAAEQRDVVDFENKALRHLELSSPDLPVPRVVGVKDESDILEYQSRDGSQHFVRLLSWLDGMMLKNAGPSTSLRYQLGTLTADLSMGLRSFFHPAAGRSLLWDITNVPMLAERLPFLADSALRNACAEFVEHFIGHVQPHIPTLRSQVVHNDLNPANVLVSNEALPRITGVIDFGDMLYAPLVCDLAITAAYQLRDEDPISGAIEVAEAFHRVTPLEPRECELLFDLIRARLLTTCVLSSWRASIQAENREYILRSMDVARRHFVHLMETDRSAAIDRFARACPDSARPRVVEKSKEKPQELLARRESFLGSAYRLFYKRPLEVVRAENVWLFGADGRAYLDAYNNVALVGHCHPHVVNALSSQAATLNTHTRYLNNNVIDYAERLLAFFPKELNKVMFSCTGSEANELALRIAQVVTRNSGIIVTRFAYHGNTTTISQMSPPDADDDQRVNYVGIVNAPDSYRAVDPAKAFIADIDSAIDRFADNGIKPAALLIDTVFTSDGMFLPPQGCIVEAVKRIRAAGGIYIADEVQAGFARLGDRMWGFAADLAIPDIVTMGKPIGNGHPLAATVVRHDVLAQFAATNHYFNTFGGNPVAAAVGMAVLDVFRDDELAENSRSTGKYLHQQLAEMARSHGCVGDIRGSGLFAGVELVLDLDSKEPASALAQEVVEGMRESGVLIGTEGPHSNILKVRPPLPFSRVHVDQLVETMGDCIGYCIGNCLPELV